MASLGPSGSTFRPAWTGRGDWTQETPRDRTYRRLRTQFQRLCPSIPVFAIHAPWLTKSGNIGSRLPYPICSATRCSAEASRITGTRPERLSQLVRMGWLHAYLLQLLPITLPNESTFVLRHGSNGRADKTSMPQLYICRMYASPLVCVPIPSTVREDRHQGSILRRVSHAIVAPVERHWLRLCNVFLSMIHRVSHVVSSGWSRGTRTSTDVGAALLACSRARTRTPQRCFTTRRNVHA